MTVVVWLGTAAPVRSTRWLDGAMAVATKLGPTTVVAAGEDAWLDLVAQRATRMNVACIGVTSSLQLDYLGWAQIVTAVVRQQPGVELVIVDEASRAERFPEVAAIAELLDAAQLTHVVTLARDGEVVTAGRVAGRELQTVRVRGPAVIGVRIAAPPDDGKALPESSPSQTRLDLPALGLDPLVLGHRALPPRAKSQPRKTVERIAEHLAVHVVARAPNPRETH